MRKLKYNKDSSVYRDTYAPTLPKERQKIKNLPKENKSEDSTNPEGYRSIEEGKVTPDLFIVISGGEKREKDYLNRLKTKGYRSVNVIFVSPQGSKSGKNRITHSGSGPKDILEYWNDNYKPTAKEISIDGKNLQVKKIDSVFFLTDLDNFRPQLESLLTTGSSEPYSWIVSNPCFEIWLYYSFRNDDPQQNFSSLVSLSEDKRPKELKKLVGDLVCGGADPRKAFDNLSKAIENSKEYYFGEAPKGVPLLFGTQMYLFAEKIWKRIKDEKVLEKQPTFKNELRNKAKT